MRAKVSGLYLLLLVQGCAHPTPAPVVTKAAVIEDDAPRYFRIPAAFREDDVLCEDVNVPGTCATVAEVRTFLRSRKAE